MRLPLILSFFLMTTAISSARELLVYIGTYTKTTSKGIYVGRLDLETGRLGELTLAGESVNPSFVALSPDRRYLYAVSEGAGSLFAGKPSGMVNAFAIDAKTGLLSLINHAASGGKGPCHLTVAPDGKAVFVANYSGGTVAMLPVLAGGGLGEPTSVIQHEGHSVHPTRQKQPYAHSINLSPDGRFAYAADLGTDKLYTCRVDSAAGTLTPASETTLAPGSGPRHLALHPDNHHAYLINELANTITVLARDPATGTMTALQTVPTLPDGFTGSSTTAEVAVHPSGRFVYGSNRGHDSIAVFGVDAATGKLTLIEDVSTQGKNPRNFSIDPTGRWLIAANQDSDNLVIFAIDQKNGRLTPTGQTITVGIPVCVKFL
ncbi:MAG: lactonase family protein [Opitutaceae bacterium]|jgi:6-phosphogluconolactonase